MGVSVPIDRAEEMLVGLCLLNDLSARDFQGWEIVPLGPFLSKNFATVISPWVVTIEALAPFRRPRMERDASAPPLLPYLDDPADAARGSFSIELQVELSTVLMRERRLPPFLLSRSHASYLYWTFAQMIAHHTVGGCSLRAGDLLGSGTISAPVRSGYGSLAEITTDGSAPVALPSGERRTYLQNGDRVAFSAVARSGAYVPIGFGRSTVEIAGDE
jgi:fumarylacetoacetase